MANNDPFCLAEWRRAVADMYAAVRRAPADEQARAVDTFRKARDDLFATHSESPLEPATRTCFDGLRYYPFNPVHRVRGAIDRGVDSASVEVNLDAEGVLRYSRVGRVHFALNGQSATLDLFWVEGYGGGLFLPFRDATNGRTTYAGGRYLYDTIKGADLGVNGHEIVLDFNYAYNPSCAYNPRWVCPLPPPENRLSFTIDVGELSFDAG
jgi:uncharacterized protein (DUF1684 family)